MPQKPYSRVVCGWLRIVLASNRHQGTTTRSGSTTRRPRLAVHALLALRDHATAFGGGLGAAFGVSASSTGVGAPDATSAGHPEPSRTLEPRPARTIAQR